MNKKVKGKIFKLMFYCGLLYLMTTHADGAEFYYEPLELNCRYDIPYTGRHIFFESATDTESKENRDPVFRNKISVEIGHTSPSLMHLNLAAWECFNGCREHKEIDVFNRSKAFCKNSSVSRWSLLYKGGFADDIKFCYRSSNLSNSSQCVFLSKLIKDYIASCRSNVEREIAEISQIDEKLNKMAVCPQELEKLHQYKRVMKDSLEELKDCRLTSVLSVVEGSGKSSIIGIGMAQKEPIVWTFVFYDSTSLLSYFLEGSNLNGKATPPERKKNVGSSKNSTIRASYNSIFMR